MKLSIGENIKSLRKQKDITQEQLSEMLGVSFQSVSRWESGVCYPDMELLPVISKIFDITVDKLLGVDDIAENKKVEEYLDRFQKAINRGKIDECISIAREGVAEYPNNYVLLDKLMYALFVSGDDTGNIPDWKENMKKYDAEITTLGERIMNHCPDQNIRLEATSRLAFNHCCNGRREIGRKIYETLPPMELCREEQIWWGLEEDEKLPHLQNQIKESYGILHGSMWGLATGGKLSPEDSLKVFEKADALEKLICDGGNHIISWGDSRIPHDKAKLYAKLGDAEKVLENLRVCAEKAIEFDNRPDVQEYDSFLLGKIVDKTIEFETADTRPIREIVRDDWFKNELFDFVRDTEKFKKIIEML